MFPNPITNITEQFRRLDCLGSQCQDLGILVYLRLGSCFWCHRTINGTKLYIQVIHVKQMVWMG